MDKVFNKLLIHSCNIYRRDLNTGSTDSLGMPLETLTTMASNVACLIQNTGEEQLEFTVRGKKEIASYWGFFKITTDIEEDDMVEWNGKKYIVIGVEDAGGQNHHKEVYLKRMEN